MSYSSSYNSDWEEKLGNTAVPTILNESASSRKLWINPINVERDEKGNF